ncbi:hypothetical protein Tco_0849310 [Tanacetum coccineum]
MSSNSDDIQAAGSDTRPPMLDRTDYESWSQRIRLYCRGKENGLQILQSIDQGPFELGTTRDTLGTTPEGGVLLGPERPRTYEDLSDTEKKRYDADVRATNIVLQGLPKDIYKLINHNIEAKAIWDNVKMLLAGSELTHEIPGAITLSLFTTVDSREEGTEFEVTGFDKAFVSPTLGKAIELDDSLEQVAVSLPNHAQQEDHAFQITLCHYTNSVVFAELA